MNEAPGDELVPFFDSVDRPRLKKIRVVEALVDGPRALGELHRHEAVPSGLGDLAELSRVLAPGRPTPCRLARSNGQMVVRQQDHEDAIGLGRHARLWRFPRAIVGREVRRNLEARHRRVRVQNLMQVLRCGSRLLRRRVELELDEYRELGHVMFLSDGH